MSTSPVQLLPYGGRLLHFREAIGETDMYEVLLRSLDWQEETIVLFGKRRAVPRLIAYYGLYGYRYAGVDHPARPIPTELLSSKRTVEKLADVEFNSVLCNYYRDGSDGMGLHRDNEPEIDQTCIASVSLGAARRFRMKHRKTGASISLTLENRSVLLMLDCQQDWEHGVPKTKRVVGGRVSLTFRKILPR